MSVVSIRKAWLRFWSLNLFPFSGHPLITVKNILSSSNMASLVYERRNWHCRHLHFMEIDYMRDDVILVPRDLLKSASFLLITWSATISVQSQWSKVSEQFLYVI